ncbi:hypothetical protein BS78_05G003300 [Paspalum vaginatum]|nr:hypothetical protein BS78_05G003300 [Paspalum vaginatum]
MCGDGIAHKRHRKGASERTEKPKEDEVYAAGSKEKGRKTRKKKKLSGSKEKKALGNWKRKDMPRSDPSIEVVRTHAVASSVEVLHDARCRAAGHGVVSACRDS